MEEPVARRLSYEDFSEYPYTHWFDRHWMLVGPFLAVLCMVYAVMVRKHSVTSVGFIAWMAFPMYCMHEWEEHAWDIMGRRYAFFDFLTDTAHQEAFWSVRRLTYVNTIQIWLFFVLGAVYWELTDDPIILFTNYFVGFTQVMHVFWAVQYRGYNPGLAQAVLINVPLSAYAMHRIYAEYYRGVCKLKLVAVCALQTAVIVVPWFTIHYRPEFDPREHRMAFACAFSAFAVPVFIARVLWPCLDSEQRGVFKDLEEEEEEAESSALESSESGETQTTDTK